MVIREKQFHSLKKVILRQWSNSRVESEFHRDFAFDAIME